MAYVAPAKNTIHFVHSGGNALNGGGCTETAWLDKSKVIDWFSSDGAPIWSGDGLDYTHATKTVTGVDIGKNTTVGTLAYVAGANITTGRYEVTEIIDNNNIKFEYIESTDDCTGGTTCRVGGAFDCLQNASDDDSANAALYNRHIFTNYSETPGQAIDIDTGSGDCDKNTWKIIEGYNTNPEDMRPGQPYYGTQVLIDGDNVADDIFYIDVDNAMFLYLRAHDTDGASGHNGFDCQTNKKYIVFVGCRADETYNGFSVAGSLITFIGCESDNNANYGFYGNYYTFLYNCISHNNGSTGVHTLHYGGIVNCAVYKNNSVGIYAGEKGVRVVNCTCYDNGNSGVKAAAAADIVTVVNSILSENDNKNLEGAAGSSLIGDFNCSYNGGAADSGYFNYGGNDITSDPEFVDAGSGDFRPRNPAVLRGGMPDIDGNPAQIGAILQKYQFTNRLPRTTNMGRLAIIR